MTKRQRRRKYLRYSPISVFRGFSKLPLSVSQHPIISFLHMVTVSELTLKNVFSSRVNKGQLHQIITATQNVKRLHFPVVHSALQEHKPSAHIMQVGGLF